MHTELEHVTLEFYTEVSMNISVVSENKYAGLILEVHRCLDDFLCLHIKDLGT